MKRNTVSIALILFLVIGAQAQKKEFGWLIGTWKLKDKNIFETWKVGADSKTLEGFSFRIKESDTVAMEKIRFTYDGTSYHYIPEVAGPQDEVDFKITRHDSNSFVAENPQHDFPKVIRYTFIRKSNVDCIEAAIEGDGKVIPYIYERIK
jgi:hypothetical protein